MHHMLEAFGQIRPYSLCGRSGIYKIRILLLQSLKLLEKHIEFLVGDLRLIEYVIVVVVPIDFFAQTFDALFGLMSLHCLIYNFLVKRPLRIFDIPKIQRLRRHRGAGGTSILALYDLVELFE